MKKQFFSNEKDGFYGTYYENPKDANCAMIGLFGDDPNDFMAKCGAKWLHKNGVNVMCMSPDVKNYSHVNFPLERIKTAIKWLKSHGNKKIGIMGMSTAGMDSLVAASYFPDITLTFGLTPSDFVWQGFEQGEKCLLDAFGVFRAEVIAGNRLCALRQSVENRHDHQGKIGNNAVSSYAYISCNIQDQHIENNGNNCRRKLSHECGNSKLAAGNKVSDRRALPLKFHLIFLTEKVCGTDGHGYRRAKRSGKCRTGKPQSHRKHENIIKHNIKQASCNSADHGP